MTYAIDTDLFVLVCAAAIAAILIVLLQPLLTRYALARPNARSAHKVPTPQGAGIAVILAITLSLIALTAFTPTALHDPTRLVTIFAATIGLAIVGATDDIRPLEALPRLMLQFIAVGILIASLPSELQVIPALPFWVERTLLLIGGVWFVNLTNFMDGIDWMTVAEVVPLTAALSLFGLMGELPNDATLVALALCGAILGFAPFNFPVARVFLGDVGSLPIGLLLAWLLIIFADRHFSAATLLPLYYLADSTITLLRRLWNGERVIQAHRSHFYQRAIDSGFSAIQIVARVLTLNIVLALLAAMTIVSSSLAVHIAALLVGCALVCLLLHDFIRRRSATSLN